jgi:hypothetical protein
MKCWICGAEATSGEHLTKASDLRALFGHRSQQNPFFLHASENLNQRVSGINSNILKSKALLCVHCNNERTQPFDRAWEKLSDYLRNRKPVIQPNMVLRLSPVFPGKVHQSMLFVHLYFLKLFGCLIVEHSIPIDIREISSAILGGRAHNKVHLAFEAIVDRRHHLHAGRSPIQTAQLNGRVSYAVWLYDVGPLSVHVMYAESNEKRKGLENSWHPSSVGKFVRFIR